MPPSPPIPPAEPPAVPVRRPLFPGTSSRTAALRGCVLAFAAVGGCAVLAMMLLTVFDVVGRRFGMPVRGAYDLVRVCGAIAIGCALPLTKAVKGHIAIEFFFQRLGRRSRAVCDTLMRLLVLGLCGLLAHQFVLYGMQFRARGETTPTLHMPVFWVQWILAAACALMVLVTLWHLLHPGRPMLRSRT